MFVGDKLGDIEADKWVTEKPDLEKGMYLIHFWNSTCLRCHTELEILAEIVKRRDIDLVILHQPEYEFEDYEHVKETLEDKRINHYAAQKPEKDDWTSKHSPKKVLVEDGEVKYHSAHHHNLTELQNELGIKGNFQVPHVSEEKHLGLKNSSIHADQRFHGEKNVERQTLSRDNISLSGRWKQTENYLEAVEDAEMHFITTKEELYLTADPQESIKDVSLQVDHEDKQIKRIISKGINHVSSLDEGQKEITIEVEKGLRIFKLDLI